MANTTTSYSHWMQQNPGVVQQVQQRYQQPQAAPAPVQTAPVVQARDSESVPMATKPEVNSSSGGWAGMAQGFMGGMGGKQPQPQPAAPPLGVHKVSSGAEGGAATQQSQQGMDGAKNIASTIASFYTGGATSAISGVAT